MSSLADENWINSEVILIKPNPSNPQDIEPVFTDKERFKLTSDYNTTIAPSPVVQEPAQEPDYFKYEKELWNDELKKLENEEKKVKSNQNWKPWSDRISFDRRHLVMITTSLFSCCIGCSSCIIGIIFFLQASFILSFLSLSRIISIVVMVVSVILVVAGAVCMVPIFIASIVQSIMVIFHCSLNYRDNGKRSDLNLSGWRRKVMFFVNLICGINLHTVRYCKEIEDVRKNLAILKCIGKEWKEEKNRMMQKLFLLALEEGNLEILKLLFFLDIHLKKEIIKDLVVRFCYDQEKKKSDIYDEEEALMIIQSLVVRKKHVIFSLFFEDNVSKIWGLKKLKNPIYKRLFVSFLY